MSTFTMMVCPHDTVKEPERWYRMEQYLIQKLGIEIQFTIALDAVDFRENLHQADIVYTNPSDRLDILVPQGFMPIAKPTNTHDEAVFVASTTISNPTLESLQGADIVTVKSLIATHIALHMLHSQGITPASIVDKDSWLSVISCVWNEEVPFGIVYKDTYDNLSDQGKGMVNVFATTNEQKVFHTIDISPKLADRKEEISQVLLGMDTDEQGQSVLNDLGIAKWLPVSPEELAFMERIKAEYG